jgi:hypothetical protein
MIQALGLEGSLELLRVKSGVAADALTKASAGGKLLGDALVNVKKSGDTNITMLTEAYGRVEALGAGLGLTGDKAKVAAEHLDSVNKSTDGLGAQTLAYNEINKATARQFEILENNIKNTSIALGTALLPSVNNFLQNSGKPLVGLLEDLVKWFAAMPPGMQLTAEVLVGVAASLGPVAFGLGQVITGFTSLAKALGISALFAPFQTAISNISYALSNGLVGGLTSGEAALLSFGRVAGIAGAAFIGWELGQWIANVNKATQYQENLRLGTERLGDQMKQGTLTAQRHGSHRGQLDRRGQLC